LNAPGPAGRAQTASSDHLAGCEGPTCGKRKGGESELEKEIEGREERRGKLEKRGGNTPK